MIKKIKSTLMKKYNFLVFTEIILFILSVFLIFWTAGIELQNTDWVGLGGNLREYYWYENLIRISAYYVFPVLLLITKMILFSLYSNKQRLILGIYTLVEIILVFYVGNLFFILILLFVSFVIKCILKFVLHKGQAKIKTIK